MDPNLGQFQVTQGKSRNSSLFHVNDGYFFTAISHKDSTSYLRCVEHRSGCPAKAIVNVPQSAFYTYNHHTHGPDLSRIPLVAERNRILNRAANVQQYATLSEVFENQEIIFPDQLRKRSLLPAVTRARLNAYPPPPQTLLQLNAILSDPQFKCITATKGFQDNIYEGSTVASDGSIAILFMTENCKDFMQVCPRLFGITSAMKIEGAPNEFQVHVLATVWDDTIIILGCVVLERSTHEAYLAAFSLLKATLRGLCQLQLILCNKESLEETAYKSVFPSVQVNCTLYSFVLSLCGKIASRTPLSHDQLHADSSLLYRIGLCCALPIIPTDFLNEALVVVRRELINDQLLMEILHELIESNHLNNPLTTFSACGNFYRTSNVSEIIGIKLDQHLRTRTNFYSFSRYLVSLAEISGRHIQLIKQGIRVYGSRAAASLSEDREIDMLVKSLTSSYLGCSLSVLNLLKATAKKQQHLLTRFLK